MELTDEQIAKLTPEQITELEKIEDDPEAVAKYLADQGHATETETNESEQEDEEGATNGADEETEEEGEEEEPVVKTKNGKREIPYSEHKALRVKVATLEEELDKYREAQTERDQLKAKVDELQSLQKQMDVAKTPSKRNEIQERFDKHIASMKEDFPDVGNSLEAVKELVGDMTAELESVKAENKARAQEIEEAKQAAKAKAEAEAAEQKRQVDEQVREATDNNPDLAHWEKNDDDAFQEAVRQDQALLLNPKWREKTIPERFVEVVRRVRSIMPDASEPPDTASAKTQAKAEAALKKAPTRKPTTLSDVQGGGNPLSEREKIENLSPGELAQRLIKMSASAASAMRADLD
jgi:hypothetical protein